MAKVGGGVICLLLVLGTAGAAQYYYKTLGVTRGTSEAV